MALTLASWNVNSLRARIAHVEKLLAAEGAPDILALQELKCTDEQAPVAALEEAGWHCALHGQKTYNGVALISRMPPDAVRRGLAACDGSPEAGDDQARYIEADFGPLTVVCLYQPNGNPLGTEKFAYKLAWQQRLEARLAQLLCRPSPVAVGGDFNIIPEPIDAFDPKEYQDDALFQPESRAAFRRLLHAGWTDALRALSHAPDRYTYWDYQKGRYQHDHGIRIDHWLLNPAAADRLEACWIDRDPRGWDKPSDHTPILVTLAEGRDSAAIKKAAPDEAA